MELKRPVPTLYVEQWKKSMQASSSKGSLYLYDSAKLKADMESFFQKSHHRHEPRSHFYRPIPYFHQYDLEVHLFLNYYKLIREELFKYRKLIANTTDKEVKDLYQKKFDDIRKNGVTGVPRAIHLLHAIEIRWGSFVAEKGSHQGQMVRNPWMELIIGEIARLQNVIVYGGGGQGKTEVCVAFLCILFDHFQQTRMGARCAFSTINQVKMESVTWPRLQKLYSTTNKDISLYAGTGRVGANYTVFREGSKSTASVIRGILVGTSVNDAKVIDKLSGVHGHDAYAYLIDEIQSTREAPIQASKNYLATCPQDMGFLMACGNWGEDGDQLASNVIPIQGWQSVDFDNGTTVYDSLMITGTKCSCIYLCNDDSPAMTAEGAKKWGHFLPSKRRKKKLFEDEAVAKKTVAYQRFWLGRRTDKSDITSFCNSALIKEGQCDREPILKSSICYLSFDSAQAGVDRAPLLPFRDGIDLSTGKRVIHFEPFRTIYLAGQNISYHSETTDRIVDIAKDLGVQKHRGIVIDWTNLSSFPEMFEERGYSVVGLRYNKSLPSDDHNKILLDTAYDEETDGYVERYAHEECLNYISLGAFALKYFLQTGRITGFNRNIFSMVDKSEHRTFEEEFCMRRVEEVKSSQYGSRMSLQDKKAFRKKYRFSTDFLDCVLQAMAFCITEIGFNPMLMDNPSGPRKNESNPSVDWMEEDDQDQDEFEIMSNMQMGALWKTPNMSFK